MSANDFTTIIFTRYRCDKRDCEAYMDVQPDTQWQADNPWHHQPVADAKMAAAGWNCWVSGRYNRKRRHYCPQHGPSVPMEPLWGPAAEAAK